MPSRRTLVDPGTELELVQIAEKWHVTVATVFAMMPGLVSDSPEVVARTQETIAAWRDGTAVAWHELTLPPGRFRTLTPTMAAWVDEVWTTPFAREGYGVGREWVWSGDREANSARGIWRASCPSGTVRIAPFRHGRAVGHFLAEDWQQLPDRSRFTYAGTILAARDGRWIDVTTGEDRGALTEEDEAIDSALRSVITYPSGSRNPVRWSDANGQRRN